jgi:DNA-binding transcriptional regulator LsrR (DeoR family)
MKKHLPEEPDARALVFRAAELFLQGQLSIREIAEKLQGEFPKHASRINRESIYPFLAKARAYGYLTLNPPCEENLANEITKKYGCKPGSVHVVDCPSRASIENVSVVAAKCAIQALKEISLSVAGSIGVGLGPGRASRDFCVAFGELLKNEPKLPKLNLVAISASGPARQPLYHAASFFNLFPQSSVDQQIGLFAETLVESRSIQEIRRRPGCREAFGAVDGIHLVVTSMGDLQDSHALFRMWYDEWYEPSEHKAKPAWWKDAIGDIQYRPYGKEGFIKEKPGDLRAVTLFELEDLVHLAEKRDRHVILIARQCGLCSDGSTKANALRPILENKHMRVFSQLVLDSPTAKKLLES